MVGFRWLRDAAVAVTTFHTSQYRHSLATLAVSPSSIFEEETQTLAGQDPFAFDSMASQGGMPPAMVSEKTKIQPFNVGSVHKAAWKSETDKV
jgi:hypothetical protein